MPRLERSAGIVLFRIDPSDRRRVYLLLNYGRFWDYPKGHVERGEDDRSAALRELAEETGIADAMLIGDFCRRIEYFFRGSKRGLIRKRVSFFLARTKQSKVRISDEHVGFAWLGIDDALQRLTYESAKQVLREAETYLQTHANAS